MQVRATIFGCLGGLILCGAVLSAVGGDPAETAATSAERHSPLGAPAEAYLTNWPSFRGPYALGHALRATPPLAWSAAAGTGIAWKSAVPSRGMSSPIVWGKRVFLTGATDEARQLFCFDTDSGNLLWRHDVTGVAGSPDDGMLPEVLHETGLAAPTPTTNGNYVLAIFATGELVCVNMAGNRHWIKHLGIPLNHYGHASSLLCHENLLFVQYDQQEHAEVLACDIASGNTLWRTEREGISWSSPILAENSGSRELVLTNGHAAEGYEPHSGRKLWRVACLSGEVAASAAAARGTVFIANEGAPAVAIDLGGPSRKLLWEWNDDLPDSASPVASDQYVIVPTAFGAVSCLEASTGKTLWSHDFAQGFRSSPIIAAGRVYLTDLSGTTEVFELASTFKPVGQGQVGEPVYATPAFAENRIYLRGLTHLYCIQAGAN